MNGVGVGKKDEAVIVLFELPDDFPHGFVQAKDVFPSGDELGVREVTFKDL